MAEDSAYPTGSSFSRADWEILAGFWHPVALSAEVAAAPLRARLLDLDLVLYRTAAGVSAALDHCPHRGTRMSLGSMRDDAIICRYHGLRFDGAGRCVLVPGAPEEPVPARLALRTFPVRERYGLVWVCLAGAARHPLPDWPQIEDPALQHATMTATWQCGAGRHTENFCDLAHFSFAHAGTFGWPERPDVPAYTVEQLPDGLRFDITIPMQDSNVFSPVAVYAQVPCQYQLTLPFAVRLSMRYSKGVEHIFDVASPVSAAVTRLFLLKARDHDLDQPVEEWVRFQDAVNEEDREMVESQAPQALPLDLGREWHLRSDLLSVAYRRRWQALGLTGG